MPVNKKPTHNSKGFSLVELLVVVSIMVTLLSVGAASYNGFNRTSTLEGATKQLRANLRLAQAFALGGEKNPNPTPSANTCASGTYTFNGYYVVLQNNATSYQLGQYCTLTASPFTPQITPRTPPSPISLPTGVTISGLTLTPITVLFQAVRGAVFYNCLVAPCFSIPVSGPISFQVSYGSSIKTLTITSDGKIQ